MAFCILKFIAGWTSVAINIKTITTIQIFVQDDFRGQVIGTLTAVSYSLIPISLLLAGTAVDMVESYVILLICGSLLVVLLGCIRLLDLCSRPQSVQLLLSALCRSLALFLLLSQPLGFDGGNAFFLGDGFNR